jgi:hypothetical protein
VVVDVGFPLVLFGLIPMRNVDVFQRGMVVLVRVGGQQMTPILPFVKIMCNVVMLVTVPHGIVVVMSLPPRHAPTLLGPLARIDRTPGG